LIATDKLRLKQFAFRWLMKRRFTIIPKAWFSVNPRQLWGIRCRMRLSGSEGHQPIAAVPMSADCSRSMLQRFSH